MEVTLGEANWVADGGVSVFDGVAGGAVRVGKGASVAETIVGVIVGEGFCAARTAVGVRTAPARVRVGVGVGRNIPGTIRSASSTRLSSRRMADSTAGFMGATSS